MTGHIPKIDTMIYGPGFMYRHETIDAFRGEYPVNINPSRHSSVGILIDRLLVNKRAKTHNGEHELFFVVVNEEQEIVYADIDYDNAILSKRKHKAKRIYEYNL